MAARSDANQMDADETDADVTESDADVTESDADVTDWVTSTLLRCLTEAERLHYPWVRLAALLELLEGELVVTVLVH